MSIQGLNTAYTGIRANQAGLEVVSHNIANVGTDGYTRQRVDLVSRRPFRSTVGDIGSGVDVAGITRRRADLRDERVRAEASVDGSLRAEAEVLGSVEGLLGELDTTLSADLDRVFAAFAELGRRPDDPALRAAAISALDGLTSRIRGISDGLTASVRRTEDAMRATADDANVIATEIAELNRTIRDALGSGTAPNDLADQRDLLVDDLARLVGGQVATNPDGTVRVSVDGHTIVDGTRTHRLDVVSDPAGPRVTVAPWGAVRPGGELGGYQRAATDGLADIRGQLDGFVSELATAINTGNAAGFAAAGVPGGQLLDGSGGAATFRVVGTAADIAVAATDPPAAFDGRNAQALAALRDAPLPSGLPPTTALDGLATSFARRVADATGAADRQSSILAAVEATRTSDHGVNLDEEMVALIGHQRALEASSRVMSAIDQVLDVLINRTGVVGR